MSYAVPDTAAPSSGPDGQTGPLTALRRRWLLGLVLVAVGAFLGALVGSMVPTMYTAEARVAVGSTDLSALSVPGYALGSQQLAANIARYVGPDGTVSATRSGSADGPAVDGLEVSASPIPKSNIIRVEATADDPTAARAAADRTTQFLIEQSAAVNGGSAAADLLARYTDLSQQLAAQAQVRDTAKVEVDRLRAEPVTPPQLTPATDAYIAALTLFDAIEAQQKAADAAYQAAIESNEQSYKLVVVNPASDSFDTASSLVQRGVLVGAVLGFLAALVAATVLARRPAAGRVTAEPAAGGTDSAGEPYGEYSDVDHRREVMPGFDHSSAR